MTPYECPKSGGDGDCHQLHTGCRGHNRRGGPCGNRPMRITGDNPRCKNHIGRRPAEVRAEYEAQQLVQIQYDQAKRSGHDDGAVDRDDVMARLLETFHDVTTWKDLCKQQLAHLSQVRYRSGSGEQLRAEIALWERALDRSARVGADLVRLGIEDRMARVSAAQSALVVAAFDGAVDEVAIAGVGPDSSVLRAAFARRMREVSR